MKFISVIPARKNSKGIKNKNIFKINKKPMIEYSFIQAKKSNLKLNFVVTDSENYQVVKTHYLIRYLIFISGN